MTCKNRAKNCGGCPLLELPYADQLKQKEEKVRALLGRYGPVHPIRGMETPYHYRNKVISTFAAGSINADTWTSVIAGKCRPRVSAHALPIAGPAEWNSPMSVTYARSAIS